MISMKKLEDKLEKKKIRLQKLLVEKDKLELKIKELRADIEKLQANQFEQFKKAAKRDDIPEILQLIKNLQQGAKIEILETPDTDKLPDSSSFESSPKDNADTNVITQHSGLRTLDSLESIASITERK